ncbi:MAG: AAA family ATPase [Pseudobutyrivibrio sp.]|nr:AAA family ATPase [Pseudobutyrivibrio sp.]
MANPKVIIADTDVNYIAPLQYKFVNDYFNNIDLEIITDMQYFNEYFSMPRNAEVLIVSEDLYDSSLKRHDIKNIFLMSEQMDDGATGDLSLNKLYKYTSIVEIFSEIVAKSAKELAAGAVEKKETQIILVTSACGGVGKTSVAMGIAASLAEGYQRVLYINASMLQNFQYLLDDEGPITGTDVYASLYNPTDNVYLDIKKEIRKNVFNYLPEFKAALPSIGIDYSVFLKIALSAKKNGEYDFIVIDADSAFDEEKLNMIDAADKVIVVTDQSVNSVSGTNHLASNINGINSEKYIFICNRFNKDMFNALIATEVVPKFSITEYITEISTNTFVKPSEMADNNGIRKVAFLAM